MTKTQGTSTTESLQQALLVIKKMRKKLEELEASPSEPIAIISMACRFPGSVTTPADFWELLQKGGDAITPIPPERWDRDAFFAAEGAQPGKMYSLEGGFLDNVTSFDAALFHVSAREAERLDPQQRLLLEVSWEALENCGHLNDRLHGSDTGVFIGITGNDYGRLDQEENYREGITTYDITGNAANVAAGRLSYTFGFQGPCMAIDTACSSSLVAVHLACQSLRNQECSTALVGGVNLILSPDGNIATCQAKMLSPQGRCKTFDQSADGYVRGEGSAVVLLKTLRHALRDGDQIHAVIRGSSTNQDAASSGLTVPNGVAQQRLIRKALRQAKLAPEQIQYIEAHGTGTSLGDPIEVNALAEVFSNKQRNQRPLLLGSVKTNIGHLEAAAGVAGLMKVVLSLQHQEIPAHLHFESPNPHIAWQDYPFEIPLQSFAWKKEETPRRAGISAFGFSGINAHVIIEEAPTVVTESSTSRIVVNQPLQLFTISAVGSKALHQYVEKYVTFLETSSDLSLERLCFHANQGRGQFSDRLAILCEDIQQLQENLKIFISGKESEQISTSFVPENKLPSQVINAPHLQELSRQEGGLDQQLRQLAQDFIQGAEINWQNIQGQPCISPLALPNYPFQRQHFWRNKTDQEHPLLGSLIRVTASQEKRFRRLLDPKNPSYLQDHRVYEQVVFPASAYIELAMAAAQAISPHASSLITDLSIEKPLIFKEKGKYELQTSLFPTEEKAWNFKIQSRHTEQDEWDLLASGSIQQQEPLCQDSPQVISKMQEAMVQLQDIPAYYQEYADRGIEYGTNFQGIQNLWHKQGESLAELKLPEKLSNDGYSLHPVLLDSAFQSLTKAFGGRNNDQIYLPVGIRSFQCQPHQSSQLWSQSRIHQDSQKDSSVLKADINFFDEKGQLVAELKGLVLQSAAAPKEKITDSIYHLRWKNKEELLSLVGTNYPDSWLIFQDQAGWAEQLSAQLEEQQGKVQIVSRGSQFRKTNKGWQINPKDPKHFNRLAQELKLDKAATTFPGIVYCWALDTDLPNSPSADLFNQQQEFITGGLLHLLQNFVPPNQDRGKLWIVTQGAMTTATHSAINGASRATLWGFARVLMNEMPHWRCTCVDLDATESLGKQTLPLAFFSEELLENQLRLHQNIPQVARLERHLPAPEQTAWSFSKEASYLITGGLGGLGLYLAKYFVESGVKQLILMGRSQPSPEVLQQIKELEQKGSKIHVFLGDVANEKDISSLFQKIESSFPTLKGVIHAAGVLRDKGIPHLCPEDFQSVFAPKVLGTWNLHSASKNLALDFFVTYSSTASILGSKGQANYAAANAFLDSLAGYRKSKGLPILNINWGGWDEIGLGASLPNSFKKQLQSQGIQMISPHKGLRILKYLLSIKEADALVLPIRWSRFFQFHAGQSTPPLLENFMEQSASTGQQGPFEQSPEFWAAERAKQSAATLPDFFLRYFKEQAAQVLGSTQPLPSEGQSLGNLGLDSLMAIELRSRIRKHWSLDMPMVRILEGDSIKDLANLLLEMSLETKETTAGPEARYQQLKQGNVSEEELNSFLDELSDAEVNQLLSSLSTEEIK